MGAFGKTGTRVVLVTAFALVAAVAGTAVAGSDDPGATSSLSKKKTKKLAKKLDKKQDKKQDKRNFPVGSSQIGDGAVGSSQIGDGAVTAEKIGPGVLDNKAGARVTGGTGALTPGTEFGGPVEVTKSATGGYCIKVPFEPKNVIAQSADNDAQSEAELVSAGGGFGSCAASLPGYQAWVTMRDAGDGTHKDEDFFLLIH